MGSSLMPLFPLASPALFPHCAAPLHVFEPRYRALTADALAGERLIGMATVLPDATERMAGDPPLFAIGCAGRIAEHERLPDGRYLMLLQATSRFRIVHEPPRPGDRLYRVAEVEWLGEDAGDAARSAVLRAEVAAGLTALLANAAQGTGPDFAALNALDDERFACQVAQALRLPGREKQALLEASSTAERLETLVQTLAFHRAWASGAANQGGPTLH
jgi:Lon protease-like protein